MTKFCEFKKRIEIETGYPMQALRSDRGGKYTSTEFKDFCARNGIRQELTQASTSQQNGVAERRNRTIMERARSMSTDCDLPTYLWTEAVSNATYLINWSPTRANSGMMPEEKYIGTIPDVSILKIFGCLVHVHVPKESQKKLDSKTQTCIFLGIDSETKAYRLYDNQRRKVIINRDIVFNESCVGLRHAYQGESKTNDLVMQSGK